MEPTLRISKSDKFKGEDSHKTFSVRVPESTVVKLEELVKETGRSRNELVNILLNFGIEHCEVVD